MKLSFCRSLLLLYVGSTGEMEIMAGRQILNIKHKDNKMIIRFPPKLLTIASHVAFFFMVLIGGLYSEGSSAWGIIFSCVCFAVIVSSMTMSYLRQLIIDKDRETISYFSYFYRTFNFSDIIALRSAVDVSTDRGERYFLVIKLKNRTINVETQSKEQSNMLRGEIAELTDNVRLSFW